MLGSNEPGGPGMNSGKSRRSSNLGRCPSWTMHRTELFWERLMLWLWLVLPREVSVPAARLPELLVSHTWWPGARSVPGWPGGGRLDSGQMSSDWSAQLRRALELELPRLESESERNVTCPRSPGAAWTAKALLPMVSLAVPCATSECEKMQLSPKSQPPAAHARQTIPVCDPCC